MPTTSYWKTTASLPQFPALQRNLTVDAVVIGGGNTGITAAYLLKKAGLKVALLERDRCAQADTGHTTAHLTHVTDLLPSKLVSRFGRDHGQAAWDAGNAAISMIQDIVQEEQIACHFGHVPGFLHASLVSDKDESESLRTEAKAANDMGFTAAFVDKVPLFGRPGVRFPNQARFHPLKYLAHLVNLIPGDGSHVFEETEANEFPEAGKQVKANGYLIHCGFVVIATDVPLQGDTNLVSALLLQTKIAPYTSYALGAWVPKNRVPDALFWDTTDPYFYLRLDRGEKRDHVIFGGADHKTGQETDPKGCFARVEKVLRQFLPDAEVTQRWSGQVIEAVDGLPYIGETAPRQFMATGYSGNGITFGTVAAMMATDAAMGRKNPWQDLFHPHRKTLRSLWNYVRENKDYPYYLVKDRIARSEGESLESLRRGEGKLLKLDGKLVAAHRDRDGKVTKVSPVCTHLGCHVAWNQAENTWDCPCHGSRFQATGEVFAGPAETPLEHVD